MTNNKKVLIIGGSSSLSPSIIAELENSGHVIDLMTFRQEHKKYGDYNWQYMSLDNENSVNNFIDSLPNNYYSKVIFLIGNSIGNPGEEIPRDDLKLFYEAFVFRTVLILNKCVSAITEDGQIVFISSIAANTAISDTNYSAVKAAIQAFVKSLSCNLKPTQSAFSIAPGLIYDTQAFYDFPYKTDIESLCTKEKIAKTISEADISYNGTVVEIGW